MYGTHGWLITRLEAFSSSMPSMEPSRIAVFANTSFEMLCEAKGRSMYRKR
jgi:hypothetical protein